MRVRLFRVFRLFRLFLALFAPGRRGMFVNTPKAAKKFRHTIPVESYTGDPRWRPDINPKTGAPWVRYRGQGKRGKPRTADLDRVDLKYALEAITEAEDLLDDLAKNEQVREALAKLDLAARFIEDVRKRCTDKRDANEPARRAAIAVVAPELFEISPRKRRRTRKSTARVGPAMVESP